MPDEILGNASGELLGIGQLLMCGCGGSNDQCLGVTHVRQVRCQLDRVNKAFTGLGTSLDTEREHSAKSVFKNLLGVVVRGVGGQTRVRNPGDTWVVLEVLRQRQCIINGSLDAEREGLQT